ncbi:endonuclease domain-containing protein [Sandarakinorhabdus sp.]|uniref:endonuclease domain-containing protein n=1 Tax=Sandarakinorhabdus sp. TaxID=1916663 RepID=UPI00356A82E8
MKSRTRTMRKTPTSAEQALWYLLRDRRFSGHNFRRQEPVGPFIADFPSYDARSIVEADGGQHAYTARDEARTRWLEGQGFRVLRFWNHENLTQREPVSERLFLALANPSPRSPLASRPSPARGEGKEEQ